MLRVVVGVAALVAAAVLAVHAVVGPPAPGARVDWSAGTPVASPGAAAPPSVQAIPTASPSTHAAAAGPWTAPLRALFDRLNTETAADGRATYSILKELEAALRDHIESVLRWAVSQR